MVELLLKWAAITITNNKNNVLFLPAWILKYSIN